MKLIIVSGHELDYERMFHSLERGEAVSGDTICINQDTLQPIPFQVGCNGGIFVINESKELLSIWEEINSICKSYHDDFLILVHDNLALADQQQGKSLYFQLRRYLDPDLILVPFHHELHDEYWPSLNKVLDMVLGGSTEKCTTNTGTLEDVFPALKAIFDKIKRKQRTEGTQALRSIVLTPLVALDLIIQAGIGNAGLMQQVRTAISDTILRFQDLCKKVEDQEGDFSDLENIVIVATARDDKSWEELLHSYMQIKDGPESYHQRLKQFANTVENRIIGIED